ncbi:malonate decarboxylase holo-ACP synthase [Pengzhenrongella sp.]|jgi:phosphoribosyl-dephospho-CoA transferase|uniref:malonate decarboxylase holo-ACP synthase n=1 Tax=Pengzhenrongella sp. TaxID=2888820 RepID=UPI002F936A42
MTVEARSLSAHDLVRVSSGDVVRGCSADASCGCATDAGCGCSADLGSGCSDVARPEWVDAALAAGGGPWAVVRRGPAPSSWVPVGVRGLTRAQRWAALVPADRIVEVVAPEAVPRAPSVDRIDLRPFRAVAAVARILDAELPGRWGILGSVAFELVTGVETARDESDLDLTVRAEQPLDHVTFSALYRRLVEAAGEVRIDVQVETWAGAFALTEWLRQGPDQQVALKTTTGPRLVLDPWSAR